MPKPIKTYTYFNGKSFESYGIVVERVIDGIPDMRENMEEKAGRDGSYLRSLTMAPREITLECRAFCDTWQDFEDLKQTLADLLVTDDDKKLVLRTHPDQYYLAHYSSFSEGDRIGGTGIAEFSLTFTATDPVRYGESRSQVIKSGENKAIDIGGTYAADLTIASGNAKAGSGGFLWFTFDGATIKVPISKTKNSNVVIDCVSHTVDVDGKQSMLTLESDWPTANPGKRRIAWYDGTGNLTISWVQRYI